MEKSNSPKLAFYYCLSLVTLIIGSISIGTILFELINKFSPLISGNYYNDGSGLKQAISGAIIAFPIYYFITRNIYKGILKNEFDIDSGARKWLTYFIIFISSVVMIGSLIGLLMNFLDGETTMNFVLKALSILAIASSIFGFYFTDIKQKEINHSFNKKYFICSLSVVLIIFISSFFIVESPMEARNRKMDQKIISNLDAINRGVDQYYNDKKVLPENLDMIKAEGYSYIDTSQFIDETTSGYYEYRVIDDKKFELCATFNSSNMNADNNNNYYDMNWRHDKGHQCITRRVESWEK
ncbi:MAG: DUF5671 domain-containing protein [Candidatus Pacebacteria bacterium]|nr:DUF5671 domain-containing protein [Candidatus Paceibacterota bacterium]